MIEPFIFRRRIEFRETDMAGIVHFSNFFGYMEQAEHALLRSVGMGVICEVGNQTISWPRVNAQCDYKVAIKFEDQIDIEVIVAKIGTKSVTYGFRFMRDQMEIASGSLTAVCCLFEHGSKPQSVPTPQPFIDAITPYLAEGDGPIDDTREETS
jgi:4-hydroxybenzoyl-CoA thioesterase/acyl-CoA thioester hydrolase